MSGPSSFTANGDERSGTSLVSGADGSPVGDPQAANGAQVKASSRPARARPSVVRRRREAVMDQTVRESANAGRVGLPA